MGPVVLNISNKTVSWIYLLHIFLVSKDLASQVDDWIVLQDYTGSHQMILDQQQWTEFQESKQVKIW